MKEVRILQSSAMGYGNVSEESIKYGLKWEPHIIVGQGTSADPGPFYLGDDNMFGYVGKINKKRDISLIISTAVENNIPFIFSGGSPSGSDIQLEGVLRIVDEICKERGYRLRIAVISGEIKKEYLISKLAQGTKIRRLVDTPRLSEYLTVEDVMASKRIVAQMGPEPIMKALDLDVDGIITGRALDIGLYMAYPLKMGFDKGLVAHMAKTIECGALCAEPPLNDNMFAIIRKDYFLVFPPNPKRRCTVASVAAHAFYERPDITREVNPGGYLDISTAQYEQYDERTVKVWGARWVPMPYAVKLEGVSLAGYRTITILGVRDPQLIQNIDWFVDKIKEKVKMKFAHLANEFKMFCHVYGRNAILGLCEPIKGTGSHELCIVVDVVAKTQELATAVCSYARGNFLFEDYPGRTSTAGNVAVLFSPDDIELGPVWQWNIWHALPLEDPCEPFPIKIIDFPRS